MIATFLLGGMLLQADKSRPGAEAFVRTFFSGPKFDPSLIQADPQRTQEPFDGRAYTIADFRLCTHPRTGEVTFCFAHDSTPSSLPHVDVENPSEEQCLQAMRRLRPKLEGTYRFQRYDDNGSIAYEVQRSVDEIPVGYYGQKMLLSFSGKNGKFTALRFPPTEAGIRRIDPWLPESQATSIAVRDAFVKFKGPTQLDVRLCGKTYMNSDLFEGAANKQHRSWRDPALKDWLIPCWVIKLADADLYIPGGKESLRSMNVYVDAEDGSIFGESTWSAGGVTIPEKPKSLNGETFDSIRFGSHPEVMANLTLFSAPKQPKQSGVDVYLYGKTRAVKVTMDRGRKLVWRGLDTYRYEGDFKF